MIQLLHSQLLQQLSLRLDTWPPYSLDSGLIRYKGCIWQGSNKSLQQKIMSLLHDSALGGHSGFLITYNCIKKLFAW